MCLDWKIVIINHLMVVLSVDILECIKSFSYPEIHFIYELLLILMGEII